MTKFDKVSENMSKIKIRNFGPIKEGYQEDDGWMDIKKVTVFVGNQGSGKSTVAKLISTFSWIEKALTRGDADKEYFSKVFARKDKGKNQYLTYHRIENYFSKSEKTLIDYKGDAFHFHFENGVLSINEAKNGDYPLPQIMYVPAERNFIANVRTPRALKQISPSLSEFVTELYNAGNAIKNQMLLPINSDSEIYVEYNKQNDIFYVKGKDYRIKLTEASSGFQSLIPLYLVSWLFSDAVKPQPENSKEPMSGEQREKFRARVKAINDNTDLTDELRRIAISELAKEFTKTAFINIVEEPEQNLFPSSQRQILNSLLEFNNINTGNKLIMTTHSPYLINFLNIAIQGEYLRTKIESLHSKKELPELMAMNEKLNKIVPIKSVVSSLDVVVYQLDEIDGTIKKLPNYEGILSDKNFLNDMLKDGNQMFDSLLEIEEEL